MSDTKNGWPDKPGVPLNPGLPGAHWIKGYTEDAWMYDGDGGWWGPGYSHKLDAETVAARYSYLGPVLSHDEATALQKRADQSALGYAREARMADLSKFLHKRDVVALQARVAELEGALQRIVSAGGLFAEPASGQHAREMARAALEGGKRNGESRYP